MFYDNSYNINNNTNLLHHHHHIHHQQNYNYFGGQFPKVIDNTAYNYPVLAPSTTTLYHQQYDFDMNSANIHSCPLMNDYTPTTTYQYNTNTTSSRPIRRYKPLCTHTIDRSIGQYQKQYAGLNWKKINDNYDIKPQQHNYDTYDVKQSRSSTTTATKKKNKSTTTTFSTSSNSKQQQQKQTNYDTYSKYTTHYDTMKVHKSRDTIKLKRIKTAVVEQQQQINNKSISSELSRQTDNSCNSLSKSSEIQQQQQSVTVPQPPPPPPPAPPLIKDLFKPIDNSFLFNRLKNKKLKKPILLADELATKSFDAVVDELKFKLEKMRTNNEHLSRLDTLLNKTNQATPQVTGQSIIIKNNESIQPQQAATSSIYSTNFKINKKIEKTKSTSSVCSQSVKSDLLANNNSNKLIKPLENCSSFNSTDSKKINSIKSDNNKCFKLEVYDSNGEESDDYTKYTRLKFTPTPNKNETSKFIDEKINYTNIEEYDDNEEEEEEEEKKQQLKLISQSKKQSAEFFTQNLFMTNKQTQSNKINQTYKNEFKEMPSGQFIKLVKTVISKSSHDKSFTSSLDLVNNTVNNEAKSDTSSSGIDSSNFLNSDDDLNNHNNNKSVLTKTNSIENFLIPSKFSSFTDYNITKNKHLNEQKISKQDEIIPQLNNLNQYNKICEQISDYVSMQNNSYFSTEFELTNDDNQMLNKYLNEMTNYYQTLNNNNNNSIINQELNS